MDGKIDFIICEDGGMWFTESHTIPEEIASKPNEEIIKYAKENLLSEDFFYIGVYWRDPNID